MIACHVVPVKGASSDFTVKQIVRDLQRMGEHGPLTIRSDQEPALVDCLRAVAKARGEANTNLEMAAKSDSQGNGRAERAVQMMEEMLRVNILSLEEEIGEKISVNDTCFPWLVEHVADCINKFIR